VNRHLDSAVADGLEPRDERRLRRLVSGSLGAAEEGELRRRLASEPALAAAYDRMTAAWDALEAPPEGVPPGFAGRVMAEVRSRAVARRLTWSQAPSWVRAVGAAALVVGLAVGAGVGSEVSSGWESSADTAAPTAVATTAGTAGESGGETASEDDGDLGSALAAYVGDGASLADDYTAALSALGGEEGS
jgi:anti-sigma factor RsiW